jgi:hypothetical protein
MLIRRELHRARGKFGLRNFNREPIRTCCPDWSWSLQLVHPVPKMHPLAAVFEMNYGGEQQIARGQVLTGILA